MLAVYPGSFDPPTVAHVAIAQAALAHVDEVRLVLSQVALGKDDLPPGRVSVEVRRAVLDELAGQVPGLAVAVTGTGLVVDIADESGADAVVVGADKWAQMLDPGWYGGSVAARDAAVGRLPRVLLVPRPPEGPDGATPHTTDVDVDVVTLDIDPAHGPVSSTRARAGEHQLMSPSARASGHWG